MTNEKLGMYEIYIPRAAEIFGVPKTREIFEQAIESGLSDKDVKTMCLKYTELESSSGDFDRARGLYVFAPQFADPQSDPELWNKWHEFEVQHGDEDTFREMLCIKGSVSASYSQMHFILPEYL
ncbi:Pre-mRNA-splicing factor SYF1 [Quillaja saponaria]|uniref:Pre-mRNA-splicing factor SYF1 n=1 Tax=Quillaja saponaria TaxID=32244 RepID=A0AAD7KVP1_QUISA|nr:Pre-mRNA-splicing factor SYF1 [Quillaja saponaria]